MPKPFTPWGITRFKGERDAVPATEIGDEQGSLVQNLYIVQGGLERRLGSALINTTLGSSFMQGLQYCAIDPALSSAGLGAAETAGDGVLLSPLDPAISANLQLYLRSDQVVGAHAAAVATWPDISGNARDATQATAGNRPTIFDAASTNGTRMILFDGNDDIMSGTFPAIAPYVSIATGLTVYCYYRTISAATQSQSLYRYGVRNNLGTGTHEFLGQSKGADGTGLPDDRYGLNKGSGWYDTGQATALGNHMIVLTHAPPESSTGVLQPYKNSSVLGSSTTNWLGTDLNAFYDVGNASRSLKGYYGAFLIYNTLHSTATRVAIQNYLINFFEG